VWAARNDETSAPPLDDYAEFIGRLDPAAGKLTPRRDALTNAPGVAELLSNQNPPDYGINRFDRLLETATNDSTGS
jgi:hypothetical protein